MLILIQRLLLVAAVIGVTASGSHLVMGESIDLWLGTSSSSESRGIYHTTLDLEKGQLSESRLAAEIRGPGFLAMHPTNDVIYAVGTPIDGHPSVVAYSINQEDEQAKLSLKNSVEIGDGGAAHVAVDPTGKMLLTAQYGGGSVAVLRKR